MKHYNRNVAICKHSEIKNQELKQKVFLMHKWDIIKGIKAQMVKDRIELVGEINRVKLYLI
jgi:hypothetical protein